MSTSGINTDVNILGGLPNWDLLIDAINQKWNSRDASNHKSSTHIKTEKSISRFLSSINKTFLTFSDNRIEELYRSPLTSEGINDDTLMMLFWNSSRNNTLIQMMNDQVFFPAMFSGRSSIRNQDVTSFLNELKHTSEVVNGWGKSTLETTASKYLTLLMKFKLLSEGPKRVFQIPYFSDKLFITFVYWLTAAENGSNLINSNWINYSFSERQLFLDRLLQPKFSKYVDITYSPSSMKIKSLMDYSLLHHELSKTDEIR